jgi:hypothetical protein
VASVEVPGYCGLRGDVLLEESIEPLPRLSSPGWGVINVPNSKGRAAGLLEYYLEDVSGESLCRLRNLVSGTPADIG